MNDDNDDNDLYEAIGMYLDALAKAGRRDPDRHWHPDHLVKGYSYQDLRATLQYLRDYGFIEVLSDLGDKGLWLAKITPRGRDFLRGARAHQNDTDSSLAAVARAVTINNTTITGSNVGQIASGGTGHTLSGAVTIIDHPQAEALRDAFQSFDAALAQDQTLPAHVKEEVGEQAQVVRTELAKPSAEQNTEKIASRWERVSNLIRSAPPLLEIGATIGQLLVMAHGGHVG